MKRIIVLTFLTALLFSCMSPTTNKKVIESGAGTDSTQSGDEGGGSGNGASPDDSNDVNESLIEALGTVELTQAIDPNTSTFRKKISIPKDFEGALYLSGLNVASLKSRVIYAKFKFGISRTPIIVPAVVGRVPGGISPLTSLDVIILDMDSQPFRNLRLLYDLYDYNDYDEASVTPEDPTQDPTNSGLYCRGLRLEDDPTFEVSASNTACDSAGETCYYSYAKVQDSTIKELVTIDSIPTPIGSNPTLLHVDPARSGFASTTDADNILKCLPDDANGSHFNTLFDKSFTLSGTSVAPGNTFTYNSKTYFFDSPYELFSESEWQISGTAVVGEGGLFKESLIGTNATYGIKSYMFPRATKINYSSSGVHYFGSSNPFASRSVQVLPAAGDTLWMDGCNRRIKNYNDTSGETISSCNVSATIEIIAYTTEGKEEVLASSKEVKIQVLQAGLGETIGKEFSAMETCSDNASCGTGSCCFNNRCWSRDSVSQCADDFSPTGNLPTGQTCSTDFDCASLCCNSTTGVCKDHVPEDGSQALCSKVPGQSCVTREYCRKENVRECYIINTRDADGNQSCMKQCFSVPRHGDCVEGTCQTPTEPIEPDFDPENPDCSNALDSAPVVL